MALLTKAEAQGKRFATGARLVAWWALRCQQRRRRRSAEDVVLPGVELAFEELQAGDQGSWSPVLDVDIQGELPEGFVVKVWLALDESGVFTYRGSLSASGSFMDWFGMPGGHSATYRARVSNADDSVVGSWSGEVFIDTP